MKNNNHICSIKSYSKMIGNLLNISCFYLSDTLKSEGHLVAILRPKEIEENINHILFGGILNSLEENIIYSVCDSFNLHYCVLKLNNNDGFFVTGPFLTSIISKESILNILKKNNISKEKDEDFIAYYRELKIITLEQLYGVFSYLINTYYFEDMKIIPTKPIHINYKALKNSFLHKEQNGEIPTEVIKKRYEDENLLLQYVAQGDLEKAANLINIPYNINKYPNNLNTKKNFLIVENTLFRRAIQQSGVHPTYIDHLSTSYMHKIDKLTTMEEANLLKYEMLVDYCNLVKKDSTSSYSPIIKDAIHFINLNLNKNLTLKAIASNISVSSQYLSTLFKQEVGQSLTEFIAKNRLEQAKYFLKESSLSISEIASEVGYADLNYFSKVFKKHYGVTPSTYREEGSLF